MSILLLTLAQIQPPPIRPGGVRLLDEGVQVVPVAVQLNCVGAGITCTAGGYDGGVITITAGVDGGSVTSVSVTTANGVSGSVANPTTTPAISLTLGAITPSSVAAVGTVTGSNLSGTNTGDQTITLTGGVTGSGTGSFAATVITNANLTGPVTSIGNATTIGAGQVSDANLASNYSGVGTCTNQFARVLNDNAAPTCASVGIADHSATGTPDGTTFLRGDNVWATPAGGASPLTTKGDLYTFTTVDARKPVGADGLCLKANSAEATGLEWAACSAGGGISYAEASAATLAGF